MGESIIAKWLNRCGWNVLPAYEVETHSGKGPRLFTVERGKLITPDMLIFKNRNIRWIEAKTKSAFTWHRISESFQTGIDRRHWQSYISVSEVTPFPVWLLFLHEPGQNAKDTPAGMKSPSGLYGQEITKLCENVDHEHKNHGRSGMVYWRESVLLKLCTYEEVIAPSITSNPTTVFISSPTSHKTKQTALASYTQHDTCTI